MRFIEFSDYLQATHFPLDGTLHTMGCSQYITIVDQAASTVDYELSHRWRMLRREEEALADPSNHMLRVFRLPSLYSSSTIHTKSSICVSLPLYILSARELGPQAGSRGSRLAPLPLLVDGVVAGVGVVLIK